MERIASELNGRFTIIREGGTEIEVVFQLTPKEGSR
jgi:hypothetical protein